MSEQRPVPESALYDLMAEEGLDEMPAAWWANRQCPQCQGFAETCGCADDGEHYPWHYTEYGVLCACGDAMDADENCLSKTRAPDRAPASRRKP